MGECCKNNAILHKNVVFFDSILRFRVNFSWKVKKEKNAAYWMLD